jgi:3-oxoacyl-[acyl-carrier protein] reductase
MLLSNKNVIVTGCNRGIGRAMLEAFAQNGADVIAHARQPSDAFSASIAEVSQKYGHPVTPVYFDLRNGDEIKNFVKGLLAEKKQIHALVNNAGITHNALFHMTTEKNLRDQFEVNFFSLFLLTQQISRLMVRAGTGSIVNIASSAGIDANPGKSAYGSSKAAVICLTKAIAAELGRSGIRANAIAPGITETEMLQTMPAAAIEQARQLADLRRGGQPSEIASAAVFLASDLSNYITGQVLRVDGGLK